MKYLLLALIMASSALVLSQKELSLEDAVMQQYRKFYPDRLTGFQWLPNTTQYVYLSEDRGTLLKSDVNSDKEQILLSTEELNEILDAEFRGFYPVSFSTENDFYINDGASYYEVDLVSKTGKTLHSLEGNVSSPTFEPASKKIAYLIDNNVMLSDENGEIIKVTQHSDPNIVSGQAIARSEFGITGGLFWSAKGNYLAYYQKDETAVHDYPLLNINDTPGSLMSIKYPMAGQKSEKSKIGIFNTKSLQTVFITPLGNEDDYLTNVSFTPDEKYLFVAEVNRGQNHMWLHVYSAETGDFVKTILEETNSKWVEPEHPAYFPCEDENKFVWMSEKDGFMNLYYYDFNGKLIDQITNHDFVVKEILGLSKDKKHLYYSATGPNPYEHYGI